MKSAPNRIKICWNVEDDGTTTVTVMPAHMPGISVNDPPVIYEIDVFRYMHVSLATATKLCNQLFLAVNEMTAQLMATAEQHCLDRVQQALQ